MTLNTKDFDDCNAATAAILPYVLTLVRRVDLSGVAA